MKNLWKSLAALLLLGLFLLAAYAAVNAFEQAASAARADAYVQDCQNRPPQLILIDGQLWDLSACG